MRLTVKEKNGPPREPGTEHAVIDGSGKAFTATIVTAQPIAEGWLAYELEIAPDVDAKSMRFAPTDSWLESGPLRCEKTSLVGAHVKQCRLDRGHFGPHQF